MSKKRYLIDMAFSEIGLSGYVFDQDAEERQEALHKLDGYMAMLKNQGVDLGYNFPLTPSVSDLDDESGLPDYAEMAIWQQVALRLCPAYGKTASQILVSSAHQAKAHLMSFIAVVPSTRYPTTLPIGRGNNMGVRGQNFYTGNSVDNSLPDPTP
jgi:hypothetical protein